MVNAETSWLDLEIGGLRVELGDCAPATVYSSGADVAIVEGDDLPPQVTAPPPGKQLRRWGTIDVNGTLLLSAYRSTQLALPRGKYDVFTDYTPIELSDDTTRYVVARLAPAGKLAAPAARKKKPVKAPPPIADAPSLADLIGTRKPASVVKLDLHHRELRSLPDLSALKKLRDLNLYGNPIEVLPPSLWRLTALEKLDLGGLPICVLPEDIGKLRKLKHLRLDDTKIAKLPRALWTLDLTELRMTGLPITVLPSEIVQLSRLTLLWIDGTDVAKLPPELALLRKLNLLRVSPGIEGLDAFAAARPKCLIQRE